MCFVQRAPWSMARNMSNIVELGPRDHTRIDSLWQCTKELQVRANCWCYANPAPGTRASDWHCQIAGDMRLCSSSWVAIRSQITAQRRAHNRPVGSAEAGHRPSGLSFVLLPGHVNPAGRVTHERPCETAESVFIQTRCSHAFEQANTLHSSSGMSNGQSSAAAPPLPCASIQGCKKCCWTLSQVTLQMRNVDITDTRGAC